MEAERSERGQFELFGFPVRVTPFYLLVIAVLGWPEAQAFDGEFFTRVGLWLGVVTVSILWHELGHALAMRRYGYTPSIVLHGLGGHTAWGRGPGRPTPMQRVWVSLAGPGAGMLLGAPFLVLFFFGRTGSWAVDHAIALMAWVNVIWGLLNLVPMVPWDGGHVVEGLLDRITGGKGRVPTAVISIVIALLAAAAAWFLLESIWVVFLCGLSLMTAVRMLRARPAAREPATDEDLDAWLGHARSALERAGTPSQLVSSVLLASERPGARDMADDLEEVLPQCETPERRAMACELAAWGRLLANQVDEADALAARMRPSHDPSPTLAALIAARRGELVEASRAASEIDDPEARRPIEAFVAGAEGDLDGAFARFEDDQGFASVVVTALFYAGHFDVAAALSGRLFERFGVDRDAYNAACSHARAGRPEEGLTWLERAIDAGFDDLTQLDGDDDLEAVRALPGGEALRDRLRAAK